MQTAIHVNAPRLLYPELLLLAKKRIFELVDAPEFQAKLSTCPLVALSDIASEHNTHKIELGKLIGSEISLYVLPYENDPFPHCLYTNNNIGDFIISINFSF